MLTKNCVILLLAAVIQSFGAGPISCKDLIDSGDSLYAVFDNVTALDRYTRAHALCPNTYGALMKMTRALIDVGEDREGKGSETFYRKAMLCTDTLHFRYPDSSQTYFLRAVAAANLFGFERGRRKLELAAVIRSNAEKSIESAPMFAPAYVVLGAYYRGVATANPLEKMLAGMVYGSVPAATLADSRRTLEKALLISPQNIYANLELAKTLVALEKKKDAVDILEKIKKMPLVWHLDKKLKSEAARMLMKLMR